MTSTNIFQGLSEGRNSSRVLRPPGGGRTDILGVSTQPEPQKPTKVPTQTQAQPETKTKTSPESQPQPLPKSQPQVEVPKRGRVPPGGFSSGLW